jgi:hypothetical protein
MAKVSRDREQNRRCNTEVASIGCVGLATVGGEDETECYNLLCGANGCAFRLLGAHFVCGELLAGAANGWALHHLIRFFSSNLNL